MNIQQILSRFPKNRGELLPEYQEIYVEEYKLNRGGESPLSAIVKKIESWGHYKLRSPESVTPSPDTSVLELGAGTLNHIPFEVAFSCYDVVEPFDELFETSEHCERVSKRYKSIYDIEGASKYNRIISQLTLEHVPDLPALVAKSALLLEEGGVFQAAIPSEGGFLWGLSWRLTTGISYRLRTGLNYKTLMHYEHINEAREIEQVLGHLFTHVLVRRFPLPIFHLSMYSYIEASGPRLDRCRSLLDVSL